MIRYPPEPLAVTTARPSRVAISAGAAKRGIFPGAIALARPGRESKLCIPSLRKKPWPGTTTPEPKPYETLVQSAVMFPSRSAVTTWLVPVTPPADGRVWTRSGASASSS